MQLDCIPRAAHTIKLVQGAGDVLNTSIAGHRDREGSLERQEASVSITKETDRRPSTDLEWLNHGGGVDPMPATVEVGI